MILLRERYRWLGASADLSDAMADVENIRANLRRVPVSYDSIRYECFNRSEAERIHKLLLPTEQTMVTFSWLFDDTKESQ